MFVDLATSQYVVVVPEKVESTFKEADAVDLGVSMRVETRDISRETINGIEKALLALRGSIPLQHSYSFGFNPESGLVEVATDAPSSAFDSVTSAFPEKISLAWGRLEHTAGSYDADTPPALGRGISPKRCPGVHIGLDHSESEQWHPLHGDRWALLCRRSKHTHGYGFPRERGLPID